MAPIQYKVGDVVLAHVAFQDQLQTKLRPVVVIEILDDETCICAITGTNKKEKFGLPGIPVEKDSEAGRQMRLKKDSFIDASREIIMKNYMILKSSRPYATCPFMEELKKLLNRED